jgi:hypothetical protein
LFCSSSFSSVEAQDDRCAESEIYPTNFDFTGALTWTKSRNWVLSTAGNGCDILFSWLLTELLPDDRDAAGKKPKALRAISFALEVFLRRSGE